MGKAPVNSISFPELRVFHKGLILVLTPLVIELLLISSLAYLLSESDRECVRETRYRRCAATGAKLLALANDSLVAVIMSYQGDQKVFLSIYESCRKKIEERKEQLTALAGRDPLAEKAAGQLTDCLNDLIPFVDKLTEPVRQKKRIVELSGELSDYIGAFNQKHDAINDRMSAVCRLQEQIAEASSQRRARLQAWQFQILAAGVAANLAAGLLLLAFYRSSISLRLKVVMDNTARLAENLSLAPLLSGSDEIAQLDRAFHKMDSDLRLATQRERALFENAGDVICVLDSELKFVKINPACQRLWGYSPADLLGRPVMEIMAPENRESARRLFERACHTGVLSDLELSVAGAGGQLSESLWSSYFSRHEGNLYCVVHDITERKQVEKLKQAFIAMMSSDLRQPLSRISEHIAELLGALRGELSQKALGYLETARKNIARLLLLVKDLLQMAQLQGGTLEASRRNCNVNELLRQAADDLQGLAEKSKIKFVLDCRAQEWYVDPNRIMQVLVNLGSNAVKFSPEGGTVVLKAVAAGAFVEVEVIDQGRGVPESHQQSIFEKFAQVDAADGRPKTGTGLGLPICKQIVEDNGGEIGVRSAVGQGSTFWFKVPVNAAVFQQEMEKRCRAQELKAENCPCGPSGFETMVMQAVKAPQTRTFGGKLTLMQKGLLLIGIPLILEVFFVCSIYSVLFQTAESQLEEQRQRRIAATAYKIQQGFIAASQYCGARRTPQLWKKYDEVCCSILATARELKLCVERDLPARAQFFAVEKILAKFEAGVEKGHAVMTGEFTDDKADSAIINRCEVWAYSISSSKRLARLIDEAEQKQFTNPLKQAELRKQQGIILALGLAGTALLSLALAFYFSRDIRARLAALADNALRFSRDLPLNPLLSGKDEIARLDASFHETAEKLAEARRKERAVFDNSRELICILDADAVFMVTNPAAVQLLGYSREELAVSSLFDLLPESEKDKDRRLLSEDLSSARSLELELLRGDKRIVHLVLTLARPQGQDCIYCVGHDISHRKQLEQIKQNFLAVVSHDLRSPLTALIVTAELIEESACGKCGEAALPVVHDITVQAEQLIDLINDFLDLEKLEASKMQLDKKCVSVENVVDRAVESLSARYPEVMVEEDFPSASGEDLAKQIGAAACRIEADGERLQQALASLLIHMSSANRPGKIKICCRAETTEFAIELSDEGPAMTREEFLSLFERVSSQRRQSGQSALALPLAASIIRAHGGRLDLVASPGGGNVYRVELPRQESDRVVCSGTGGRGV
jgi:PAS domain S-box-containing protein